VRLDALTETTRRELDCEVEATRDAPCPPLPAGSSPAGRVRDLEREIRLMGPINPLALEEFAALQERQSFLEGQLEDVRSARRELGKVIRAIDGEIVDVFRAAYADVSEHFERLFSTLFPGGQGRLRLTDPDHLLETGIDVEARPSGKNIRRLSLLSGGERSLTALALLFAVFRSRPSPFYLMDEVEAALDDVNLLRFLELLREFREEAQLLVVSHQKRTMEAADWLYGVTMQPGGSSVVVSERISTRT
jgi:chromosome segregation protein